MSQTTPQDSRDPGMVVQSRPVGRSKLAPLVPDSSSSSPSGKPHQKPKVRLREVTFDDYGPVTALQSKYGLRAKGYEEWKDLWLKNPAFREYRDSLPMGWVLESEKHDIFGYLGNIPLIYELEGRRLLGSVAHAWVVEEDYRSYSLLLLQQYFAQKKVDLFLNATVGPLATEAFAVFESLPVPVGAWDEASFCITSYSGFLASWLQTKQVPFSTPLSYLLGGGLFLKENVLQPRPKSSRIEVQLCTEFDSRFDTFWENLRHRNSGKLIGLRNREALQWHYGFALQQKELWIVTVESAADITAYALFLRYDNPQLRLCRMRLVDFQTLDANPDILAGVFSWAAQKCRKDGIHMLEYLGFCSEKRDVLDRLAVHKRKMSSWLYYYKSSRPDLAQRLSDPKVWDPCQFDGDASL